MVKPNINKCKTQGVVIHTAGTVSNKYATEMIANILVSTHKNEDIEKIKSIADQLNTKERKLLLGSINNFEDFFDSVLGKWDTAHMDI